MPKYEVLKDCYLDQPDSRSETGTAPKYFKGGLGTKISYEGWPNASLEPVDAEAERRAKAVAEHRSAGLKLPATVDEYDKQAKSKAKPKPQEAPQPAA